MSFKKLFIFTALVTVGFSTFGQKIKYKELFILLNAKQYDQAEPFLKRYLVDNMDNPNALLYMGYILEEKAIVYDVLTELEKINKSTDSSVLFFDLAYKGIDEKELRKNDEYYQMYSRRDLRTGKFGIKLSDVQLDLEKRMKFLKDRQQRILKLHELFAKAQKVYGNCEDQFKTIADRYKDNLEFFLRSDDALKTDLRNLARRYDSLLIVFNDYTTQLASLGKTGHNQELDVQSIENFKHDGYTKVDFLQDEIKIWDFKRWALGSLQVIESEIDPAKASLVKIDADLNGLREKLRKDSVDVSSEAKSLLSKATLADLKKYDPNPMPLNVFNLKIQELNYGSYRAKTKVQRDSSGLKTKQVLLKNEVKLLSKIDSVAAIINKRDLDYDIQNYKSFVTDAFGNPNVLKSLIKTTGDFALAEKTLKEAQVKAIDVALNWIIDGQDSIPASTDTKSSRYAPLAIVPDKYTYGIILEDTVKAYFYSITPSHKVGVKAVHQLDTMFRREHSQVIRGIVNSTTNDEYFILLYSFKKVEEKFPAFVYMAATHGMVWSNKLMLDGIPEELVYNAEGKGLSIKVTNEAGSKTLMINKEGKLISN